MSELVTVTLKMTTELRDRLKARATAEGASVSALLIAGAGGLLDGWPGVAETYQATTQRLEAEVATLTKDRDQWRDRAKAIVSAGAGAPVPRLDAVATKTIGRHRHLGNPLQPTTGLPVGGMAVGFNLKGGQKPGR